MSDDAVIDFATERARRGLPLANRGDVDDDMAIVAAGAATSIVDPSCAHAKVALDPDARVVYCQACKVSLDTFDVFMTFAERERLWVQNVREAQEARVRLLADMVRLQTEVGVLDARLGVQRRRVRRDLVEQLEDLRQQRDGYKASYDKLSKYAVEQSKANIKLRAQIRKLGAVPCVPDPAVVHIGPTR